MNETKVIVVLLRIMCRFHRRFESPKRLRKASSVENMLSQFKFHKALKPVLPSAQETSLFKAISE